MNSFQDIRSIEPLLNDFIFKFLHFFGVFLKSSIPSIFNLFIHLLSLFTNLFILLSIFYCHIAKLRISFNFPSAFNLHISYNKQFIQPPAFPHVLPDCTPPPASARTPECSPRPALLPSAAAPAKCGNPQTDRTPA